MNLRAWSHGRYIERDDEGDLFFNPKCGAELNYLRLAPMRLAGELKGQYEVSLIISLLVWGFTVQLTW